uniref:Protein Shroom1 n=1 Tax=Haemonchus contortus TaxID=6289 RepID=A0A7I4Y4Q5_HAECO
MNREEFGHHILTPSDLEHRESESSGKVAQTQHNLPSLSREHFRPLFRFSTPWYSSCDQDSNRNSMAADSRPTTDGSYIQTASAGPFAVSASKRMGNDLVEADVEVLADDDHPISRAVAGSDPPGLIQQRDSLMSCQASSSDDDERPGKEVSFDSTSLSQAEKSAHESEEFCKPFDVALTENSVTDRDITDHSEIFIKSWQSGSQASLLQASEEDGNSPLDLKFENTKPLFEEFSYETENSLEIDNVFNESYSVLDTQSYNVLSLESTPGAWRSCCTSECSLPEFKGDYQELLTALDSTYANVARMKQRFREILEELKRKLG